MDEILRKTLKASLVFTMSTPFPNRQQVWRRRSANMNPQISCVNVDFDFFVDELKCITSVIPMKCRICDTGIPPNAPGAAFLNAVCNTSLECEPNVTNVVYTLSHPQFIEIVHYGTLSGKSYCTDPFVKAIFVKEGVPTTQYQDLGTLTVTITTDDGVTLSSLPMPLAAAEYNSGIPIAPSGFYGNSYSSPRRVILNWSAAEGHTAYEIQRMTGSGPWVSITAPSVGATTYTDTTVVAGSSNCYRIRAINTYSPSPSWISSNVIGVS